MKNMLNTSISGAVFITVIIFLSCAQDTGNGAPQFEAKIFSEGYPTTAVIEGPSWTSQLVMYDCENGMDLQVNYLNMESGESFAALYYKGNLSLMRVWPAASGARYIAVDEQNSFRWHTKADGGILSFLAADHTAEEQILLKDCKIKLLVE